jgi:hypothetical protein
VWRTLAFLVSVPALGCSDGTSGSDEVSAELRDVRGSSPETTSVPSSEPGIGTSAPRPADGANSRAGDEIEQRRGPLQWAPPEGWQDYDVVELPVDGGRLRLDPGIDYRLTADRPIEGPLEIIGGRNVVWIGGAIVIDRPEPVDELHRAIGLLIRDDDDSVDRTVHLEGLLLDGSGLNDGVNVDAPSAIVQLQNVHVATVTFDGADDRDGTGPYDGMGRNHPDVVQVYGGHRELRIDGLTATSAYQGLFLKVDHPDGRGGTVRMRNVDVSAVEITGLDGIRYAGNRMYFWDAQTIGDQYIENGTVWIRHHPGAGKVAGSPNARAGSGSWWHGAYRDGPDGELVAEPPPGSAGPGDAVERLSVGEQVVEPRFGTDRHGRYLWWPESMSNDHSDVRNADGDAPGRLHVGAPPDGPYVPRSTVGLAYRSPGYADDTGGATE